jgi:hypothetical protein
MLGELAEDIAVDLGAGLAGFDFDSHVLSQRTGRRQKQGKYRTGAEYPLHHVSLSHFNLAVRQ